ncbi:MAG TPA: AAA family ATPase, partial [Anaerovoracaceae bacterium]|nr:AAA family ATPase [Anaerovoracaceae bacterium]
MEIKREYYLNQIKLREQNGMVKVITGVRRCGKSYMLFELFMKDLLSRGIERGHIIDIALDSIENEQLREPHVLFEFLKSKIKDKEQYYIFLDEIQFVDRFTDVLNGIL